MRTQCTPEEIERFWRYVDKSAGDGGCWLWTRKLDKDGYGHFTPSYVDPLYALPQWGAHRFSFFVATGIHPGAFLVCHHCDNPTCVNPFHLFLGTALDNCRDMHAKGRHPHDPAWHPRGTLNPKSKLTDEDVIEIRRRWAFGGVTKSQLGREFGISSTMASWIVLGRFWKHLPSVDELKDAA